MYIMKNMQFISGYNTLHRINFYYLMVVLLFGKSLCLLIDDKIKMSAPVNKYCESSCESSFDCKERNSQYGSDIDGNMQHIAQLIQIFNVLMICHHDEIKIFTTK